MSKHTADNTEYINNLSEKLSKIFLDIDKLKKSLLVIKHDDVASIRALLLKFTAYYTFCLKPYKKLEGMKKNRSHARYLNYRDNCNKDGEKFVSAVADREAELFVADERDLRDIVEAYKDSCLEGVRTCRTILNMHQKTQEID